MKSAIFCGSFDPMTLGHLDILKKAGKIFDKIYVAVPQLSGKSNGFSFEDRIKIANASIEELSFAEVVSFSGLLTDFCKAMGVFTLVRGLRNHIDFAHETDLIRNYKYICDLIECTYFISSPHLSHISSSVVREILQHGGSIRGYVSKNAEALVLDSFSKNR